MAQDGLPKNFDEYFRSVKFPTDGPHAATFGFLAQDVKMRNLFAFRVQEVADYLASFGPGMGQVVALRRKLVEIGDGFIEAELDGRHDEMRLLAALTVIMRRFSEVLLDPRDDDWWNEYLVLSRDWQRIRREGRRSKANGAGYPLDLIEAAAEARTNFLRNLGIA